MADTNISQGVTTCFVLVPSEPPVQQGTKFLPALLKLCFHPPWLKGKIDAFAKNAREEESRKLTEMNEVQVDKPKKVMRICVPLSQTRENWIYLPGCC
jgi:hypothetical protein